MVILIWENWTESLLMPDVLDPETMELLAPDLPERSQVSGTRRKLRHTAHYQLRQHHQEGENILERTAQNSLSPPEMCSPGECVTLREVEAPEAEPSDRVWKAIPPLLRPSEVTFCDCCGSIKIQKDPFDRLSQRQGEA